jgi:hypothetical protein
LISEKEIPEEELGESWKLAAEEEEYGLSTSVPEKWCSI